MRIRYGYDTDAKRHEPRCTIRIRYGYDATRYDTLVRDNDGSLPPDRVREPIKFIMRITTLQTQNNALRTQPSAACQTIMLPLGGSYDLALL